MAQFYFCADMKIFRDGPAVFAAFVLLVFLAELSDHPNAVGTATELPLGELTRRMVGPSPDGRKCSQSCSCYFVKKIHDPSD